MVKTKRRIIDLSMNIEEGMQTFAAYWHPLVEIVQIGRHGIENRETRKITMGTHTGTHIDAPRHFIPGGKTVDEIELSQLTGTASVIDFSHKKPFEEIEVAELENAVGQLPVEKLIFRFDWDKQLNTNEYYSDHPYFSAAACQWLVDNGCHLIASDTPQPDNPKNGRCGEIDAPNHKILLGNNVVIVEYLINICEITQPTVELIVAPLKITEGDGAPARCFAIETINYP